MPAISYFSAVGDFFIFNRLFTPSIPPVAELIQLADIAVLRLQYLSFINAAYKFQRVTSRDL